MEMDGDKVKQALKQCQESINEEKRGNMREAYELLQTAVATIKEQIEFAPTK